MNEFWGVQASMFWGGESIYFLRFLNGLIAKWTNSQNIILN